VELQTELAGRPADEPGAGTNLAVDTAPATLDRFRQVRAQTARLASCLSDADATVQSMPEASPAKWHLAHTTWFFETLVLAPFLPGYAQFDANYAFLFNSYYEALGTRLNRASRGMLTRPSLGEVLAYRAHVDAAMADLLCAPLAPERLALVDLGIQHEQQHQELLLTDVLHLFASNPLEPAYLPGAPLPARAVVSSQEDGFAEFAGGLLEFGHAGPDFAFDCEGPRHQRFLVPFRLALRPVTAGDWVAFIADDGYRRPELWLSDGWAACQAENWTAPLYWRCEDGGWTSMTLRGRQPLDPAAPVGHVSYFEADAYARWRGLRLPTEFEWEHAAAATAPTGNFLETGALTPRGPAAGSASASPAQLFGDVWEWTDSPYVKYPGFRPLPGAPGEYNGKFMSGQMVLRGGSCATPQSHIRATYRNFFHPAARWQFSGLRLAGDA